MPRKRGQPAAPPGNHAVQFYDDDHDLTTRVIRYLGEGLSDDGSAVVVATLRDRLTVETALAGAGIDISAANSAGRLLMLDAAETMRHFWTGDQLYRRRFSALADKLVSSAACAGRPVRIYAEMVALLWDAGHVATALRLEELWNEVRSRLPFSLLCAYPARIVSGEAGAIAELCRLHTTVVGEPPGLAAGTADRAIESAAVRSFPLAAESAAAARRFVLDTLGPQDELFAVDAAILTAELAANAVLHARSRFSVAVSLSEASVRISVRDYAPLRSASSDAPLAVRHGHGLWVVSQVAASWAVEPLPDGKIVWAELPRHPGE